MRSWDEIRWEVLRRDDFTCQVCFGYNQVGFGYASGYPEQIRELDVHHKVKTPQNYSDDL
jgi:hypothetical protein